MEANPLVIERLKSRKQISPHLMHLKSSKTRTQTPEQSMSPTTWPPWVPSSSGHWENQLFFFLMKIGLFSANPHSIITSIVCSIDLIDFTYATRDMETALLSIFMFFFCSERLIRQRHPTLSLIESKHFPSYPCWLETFCWLFFTEFIYTSYYYHHHHYRSRLLWSEILARSISLWHH